LYDIATGIKKDKLTKKSFSAGDNLKSAAQNCCHISKLHCFFARQKQLASLTFLQSINPHFMQSYEKLLRDNKHWASEKTGIDPEYFERLSKLQQPEFLWIGCSDSRVPANEITGTQPGEIFVHRNVANLVVNSDVNLLSVLDYAVTYLKVRHVIICGHYGCGGIKAAASKTDFKPVLNMWLRNIKDVMRLHRSELEAISDGEKRNDRLVELNVQEQVYNLSKTTIIQRCWKKEQRPHLHGWVYGLKDGIIKPVCEMTAGTAIDDEYAYEDL
jgi:carbonic anhydrase